MKNINTTNSANWWKKVNGIFCPIIVNNLSENFQEWEYFNLQNWERLEKNEIDEWKSEACNDIIKKYWFSDKQWEIFKERTHIEYNNTEIGNRRWDSYYKWSKITDTWVLRIPDCIISMNPNLIENKKFYKAILIHEIDHWAFRLKRFFNSKLFHTNPSNRDERQVAVNEYNRMINSDAYGFSTELLARVDTSDILASKNWEYSRDEIERYWLWNEHETTGEPFYTPSIIYAKKFLKFQIDLYNKLGKWFKFDNTKPINQQLSNEANKHFQNIMNRLRWEIFNSQSIERCKNVIDRSYEKLQNARTRKDFTSMRQ